MTLLDRLNRCPPAFCRLVARKNRGRAPMTRRDIASASGLSLRQIDYLSPRLTWSGCSTATMSAFAAACGVDLLNPERHFDWLRRRKRSAWRKNPKVVQRLRRLIEDGARSRPR